ncbi:hypothetical protein BJX63DRAFT_414727 [Aspergillus granulosus]|uniref:AAA+ ATPase domain-containing protein n=1 Tax=Aspergillus granulosus TaxID=176169 RepID=A0ABR4GUP6_9EURO
MRPESRNDFTVAIICALTLEADAVEAFFDETYDRLGQHYKKQPGDANAYVNGRIGAHNVVLCYMPGMGKGNAASVASSLQISYPRVRLALVVGICGGLPQSSSSHCGIFLGDVLISDSVVEYDFGRQYPDGFERKADMRSTLGGSDREIRTLLSGLRAERARAEFRKQMLGYLDGVQEAENKWRHPGIDDVLFEAAYIHEPGKRLSKSSGCFESDSPQGICAETLENNCEDIGCDEKRISRRRNAGEHKPSVHIGTIATADTVMKSTKHRDEIGRKERVVGFEMEGAGVWNNLSCIIIKGVCDYADSHKNKRWQAYAAATGACAAKVFLDYLSPDEQEDATSRRQFIVPFARNPRFVGRQNELVKLERLISTPDGPRKLAIVGLGGIGKTQMVLELAYRTRDKDPECSIFWVPCTGLEAVDQAYVAIARMVGLDNVKSGEVKERIKAHFNQRPGKWLLIFDNADDMEMWITGGNDSPPLQSFLPRSHDHGRIIFTTRTRKLAMRLAPNNVIPIPELDRDSGMKFLENSLIKKELLEQTDASIALLERLTFLPLAVAQAAAYINENGLGISGYLDLLDAQETEVMELLSEDFGDETRYENNQNPVAKTWLISFDQIRKLDQLAAEYLSLMACVNPRDIPQSYLPRPESKARMVKAIGLLSAYSFVTFVENTGFLSFHRLVYLATRNWLMKEQKLSVYILKAADRLDLVLKDGWDESDRQLWQEYLPHISAVMGEDEFKRQQEQGKYIGFLKQTGRCLGNEARYREAEAIFTDILALQRKRDGLNESVLRIEILLAWVYRDQGLWREAEDVLKNALSTYKGVLGMENSYILQVMSDLAFMYDRQGRLNDASDLGTQTIKLQEELLGIEHRDTLESMSSLARVYQKQGRWNDAVELGNRTLEIQKRVLGPEDLDTLATMDNLVRFYREQGMFNEAEQLANEVLKIREPGPELQILPCLSNLALIYGEQQRWQEAEDIQVRVLGRARAILGPEHPDTLIHMANLALTYSSMDRWTEAVEMESWVLETEKRVFGPEHPYTTMAMNNLACSWKSMGKHTEALQLMKECAKIRTKKLGADHPQTLVSKATLASWWDRAESSSYDPLSESEDSESYDVVSSSYTDHSDTIDEIHEPEKPENETKGRKRAMIRRLFGSR